MAEESRDSNDGTSVRVAIRIRPQNARERIDMCQVCTFITPGEPQVTLGNDKCFTYDSVFNVDSTQEEIYDSTARGLIEGCFEGYNATIFAYGQTGSGKTFTMGTGFEPDILPEIVGIIPRAVAHLFNGIEKRRDDAIKNQLPPPDFKVHAEFMELYNEEIIDLLDTTRDPTEKGRKSHIKIHEDAFGGIYTVGVTTQVVTSLDDTMQCLKVGALSRTTASTNMNATSSRSHAIFTLHVKQHRIVREDQDGEEGEKETDTTEVMNEFETLTAKFHFVDLAGSERLKRTGATGDRMKEGISINSGLLALGNVISALGDKTKKGSHVPYRDSKLTRLLQDSLGGNSRTQMIACVSPCDRDFMETLSTLKYANRARNIRNKVSVNQDKTSKQIAALRQEIILLQEELMEYKTGKRTMDADGSEALNDLVTENAMIQTDNKNLRARIKALQETIEHLQARNTQLLADKAILDFQNISGDAPSDEVTSLVKGYIHEIEELRTRLTESEAMCETIKRTASHSRTPTRASPSSSNIFDYGHTSRISGTFSPDNNLNAVIEEAKRDIAKAKKKVKRTKSTSESDKENVESKANKEADENEKVEDDEEDDVDDEDDNDEDDDDVDDDEDEEVSSDSDSEEKGNEIISEELANITCDINIKEQLIEKLESSQKQMNAMKQHYEEKLKSLSQRIKDTEKERDQVLQSLEKDHSSEKVAKVRDEFKKKLNDLQSDLKKMSAATKEHAKLVKNNTSYQMQLKTATKELSDMKKLKVKLMKQMKEEAQKSKQAEMRNQREVMGLKREQRKKEGRIKSLEIENRQKEIVLRRKQEEMLAMRRKEQQRPMSAKAAGRVGSYDRPLTRPVDPISRRRRKGEFSAKAAKQKWDTLEKNVIKTVSRKQTLIAIEKDMDLWLKRRDELIKKTEKRKATRDNAVKMGNKTPEDMRVLDEQISSLQMQINDAQDRISDCQNEIMEMEESRDMEDLDPAPLLEKCNLQEAKYLIEHFMALAVNKGLACMQKENEVKEISANLHRFEVQNKFQYDLLQHIVVDSVHGEFDDSLLGADQESDSTSTSRSSSPIDSDTYRMMEAQELLIGRGSLDNVARPNKGETKARRKTATTEDLLFCGGSEENIIPVLPIMPEEHEEMKQTNTNSLLPDKKPSLDSLLMPPPSRVKTLEKVSSDSNIPRNTRPTSVPVQKDQNAVKNDRGISPQYGSGRLSARQTPEPSPVLRRKNIPAVIQPTKTQTPSSVGDAPKSNTSLFKRSRSLRMSKVEKQNKINQSASSSSISSSGSTSDAPLTPIPPERRNSFTLSTDQNANNFKWSQRQTSIDSTPDESPMGSPMTSRKREDNVFSRLTHSGPSSPKVNRGVIAPYNNKANFKTSPLVCTHVAEGHTKAVLSVFATDTHMFSSSKDRNAKVWDLNTGQDLDTYGPHPNNVIAVRFSEENNILYTVSTSYIYLWDIRAGSSKCIKTLSSSGLTQSGQMNVTDGVSRLVSLPPGETTINDISLAPGGSVMYSAASNTVRIWDLRKFMAVGKLTGGHQAAVMVLEVGQETNDDALTIVTGSKDHYIKVFDVQENSVGVLGPKYNLEPPHYDGIQSLALSGDLLFSGSRDTCIKKWDLSDQSLKQSINGAHKDWICGLAFMPGGTSVLSGCRGGMLKLWSVDNCNQLGEIKAHSSPINAITTNSSCIFTASNECGIKIWSYNIDNNYNTYNHQDQENTNTYNIRTRSSKSREKVLS